MHTCKKITLFHGTSFEYLDSILEKGLLPWNFLGRHNWYDDCDMTGFYTPKRDCVYLAKFPRAKIYSESIGGREGVILQVHCPVNNLEGDEDSNRKDWESSLSSTGTCAYRGVLPAESIKRVIDLNGTILFNDYNRLSGLTAIGASPPCQVNLGRIRIG